MTKENELLEFIGEVFVDEAKGIIIFKAINPLNDRLPPEISIFNEWFSLDRSTEEQYNLVCASSHLQSFFQLRLLFELNQVPFKLNTPMEVTMEVDKEGVIKHIYLT